MRERLRDDSGKFRARTYEVTVWNMATGDIEYRSDQVTETELRDIEERYDEPIYQVQVEDRDGE